MSDIRKEVIKNLCDCNMNVSQVARVMYCHRNTVMYHVDKVKKDTGLVPLKFHDLVKLHEMYEVQKDKEERHDKDR